MITCDVFLFLVPVSALSQQAQSHIQKAAVPEMVITGSAGLPLHFSTLVSLHLYK